MSVQTKIIQGKRKVILDEERYYLLLAQAGIEPPLPEPDEKGNYPAVATVRVLLARDVIRDRKALGLSQEALARQAGVRVQTLGRLETGRYDVSVRAVDKIDAALEKIRRRQRGNGVVRSHNSKRGRSRARAEQ